MVVFNSSDELLYAVATPGGDSVPQPFTTNMFSGIRIGIKRTLYYILDFSVFNHCISVISENKMLFIL